MSYRNWLKWLRALPWELRWFVLFVLIRPIVDNLYHLKNISPFVSPPYIIGVLTPFLAILAIYRIKSQKRTNLDRRFRTWVVFITIGTFFYLLYDPLNLATLEFILKLTMPVYLFFFLRLLIRSKEDLHGLLQTYVYSSVFVGALLLYEVLISPIRIEHSRGLERIQGNFADVTNYGFYLNLTFLILAYFFFSKIKEPIKFKSIWPLALATGLAVLCLTKINHVASLGVFIALILLYVAYNVRVGNRGVLALLAAGIFVIGLRYSEQIIGVVKPLIETDLAVYQGEKDTERLMHGRVGRWKNMYQEFSNQPIFSQMFGMPTALVNSYSYVSSGTHNDFLRILFFTGYFGLIVYIGFLWSVFRRSRSFPLDLQFLVTGGLTVIMLYSISANPTIYAPLLYVILSIFAYVAMPIEGRISRTTKLFRNSRVDLAQVATRFGGTQTNKKTQGSDLG